MNLSQVVITIQNKLASVTKYDAHLLSSVFNLNPKLYNSMILIILAAQVFEYIIYISKCLKIFIDYSWRHLRIYKLSTIMWISLIILISVSFRYHKYHTLSEKYYWCLEWHFLIIRAIHPIPNNLFSYIGFT